MCSNLYNEYIRTGELKNSNSYHTPMTIPQVIKLLGAKIFLTNESILPASYCLKTPSMHSEVNQ